MIHLVADVGNTSTVIGLFRAGSLEVLAHRRFATAAPVTEEGLHRLVGELSKEAGHPAARVRRTVVGSVVPHRTESLLSAFLAIGDGSVRALEGLNGLPIRVDPDDPPEGVGVDRIANVLAATHLFRRDTIVVDLGTATTYDCVTADGVFMGGVIAPGVLAGGEWLATRTAMLPRVDFQVPAHVIGRRTEDCVRSGVFFSVVDAVDGMIRRIEGAWGRPGGLVVATGGHAGAVAGHSRFLNQVEPHLTLVGLEIAGQYLTDEPGEAPDS